MKRFAVVFAAASVLAGLLFPTTARTAESTDCGVTTLEGTLVVADDGTIECGPPEEIVVRGDLATPGAGRDLTRQELISFASMADLQWADEESPLRGEWADKCMHDSANSPISNSAFRPQETMVGQIANSHVRAINEIAAEGSPVLHSPLDLVLTLGDLADNQQLNEVRYFVDTFDGDKLIDPDSGHENPPVQNSPLDNVGFTGDGYDGVQGVDPKGSGVPLPSEEEGGAPIHNDDVNPLDRESLLDLANEPFYAPGLRYPDGSQIPWYALPGNHDVKVQGTIFDDNAAWRALVRRYATGHTKIMELAPDYQSRLCAAIKAHDQVEVQAVMADIFSDPTRAGTTKVVPSDTNRLPIYRSDEAKEDGDVEACIASGELYGCDTSWVEEQAVTTGLPVGHGYTEETRCKDEQGNLLSRLCYSFVQGDFLFVGLDTSPAEGLEGGSIDVPQFEWMERTIREHSTRYFDESGTEVTNPGVEDKLVIVFSHHPTSSLDNTGLYSSGEERLGFPNEVPHQENGAMLGDDLVNLLTRYPNVIMHSSGHTHRNNVWVHKNEELGTGYYEVNTASVADMPSESRMFEIADNNDGTLSIFSTIIEGAAPPNPRDISWTGDDPTSEVEHGGTRNINESWLASFGREVGYHDPQGEVPQARGSADVRNVELLLPAPFDLSPEPTTVATSLIYTGDMSGKIGKKAVASVQLTDANGAPLENQPVTFQHGNWTTTAVTDASGFAEVVFKVKGPKGTVPLTVSFAGTEVYLPSEVSVPFTVR